MNRKKSGPSARVMFSSIGAGFLAFVGVCSLMDAHALAADYTLPEPVTVVKEYYVDPQPAAAVLPASGQYTALNALHFSSAASAKSSKQTKETADAVSAFAGGFFSSRYSALHVDPQKEEKAPASEASAASAGLSAAGQAAAAAAAEEPAADGAAQQSAQKAEEPKEEKTVSIKQTAGGGYSKMQSWKEVNSDVVGYLYIPGTNIDYPVVQGANNNTYAHLDIYKNSSRNGVIWADCDVRASSKNTILYGHNWTNVSANPAIGRSSDVMFAQLTAYQHASFMQSHPTIQYANANGDATWVVFATLYTTDLNSYIYTNVSPTSLAKWAKGQTLMCSSSIDIKDSDQILTLSTCTRYYGQFENQRFVVMARKLRDGERLSSVKVS
ncbi:MAG: class B sortase [Provencibacterium sp.]|nr:class B sortase [Provencibacterium sp.]